MADEKETPKIEKTSEKLTAEAATKSISDFSQGEQGISLRPVGSHRTDPFLQQDSKPPTQTEPPPANSTQVASNQSSQSTPKTSDG